MRNPPMLELPERGTAPGQEGPDPVVSVIVALVAATAIGLLLAGFLAVYDYQTPGAELPAVLGAVACFGAAVAVRLVASAVRWARRERAG